MTNLRFGLSLCAILSVGRVLAVYDDVTVEKYPDADAVVIDTDTKIEYAPDGSYVRISDDKIKVLTEKGRREESEISLHYNRRYGTAEIVEVKIIAEDGRRFRDDEGFDGQLLDVCEHLRSAGPSPGLHGPGPQGR